jgi:UDP-3-O-[3-hydroxymyristoyl] glucosamine N-acyltransferase
VSDNSSIGARTIIYPGAYVGFGVVIGEDSIIYPNVSILDNVTIGNRVVVHAGSVIGSDGFGYIQRDGSHVKVPQVGSVRVEDDVEIGACVTIDRATTGVTVIGAGTKLDNLIQIAHNVTVGKDVVIAAQSGIAGSSSVGDNVMAGGRVAVSDHVEVEAGCILAGRTSVHNNLKRGIYAGTPAIPHRAFLRSAPLIGKLPELFKRIKELERKLEDKEAGGK